MERVIESVEPLIENSGEPEAIVKLEEEQGQLTPPPVL